MAEPKRKTTARSGSTPTTTTKRAGSVAGFATRVTGGSSAAAGKATSTGSRRTTLTPRSTDETSKQAKLRAAQLYDFQDERRGPFAVLVNQAETKTGKRWITLTEWPKSLVDAYDAGILTGEAEILAKGLKAIKVSQSHPWKMAFRQYRKPTEAARL